MNKVICGFFLTLMLPVLYSYAQQPAPFNPKSAAYLWPTNASQALSGTFAETRSAHFHSALDIKTWGRRGYPVYATRSGTLHRMAIGPKGYGKVLYLEHNDSSYSVYAHLLRFNDSLQQLADSIRFSDYSSSFDLVLDSLNIQIEQGEEIALSGASGIGPPHLHFELRTPRQEPFNPLLTNLKIRDTIAPSFSGLAVEPLSIESKIEGRNRYYTKPARRGSEFADFGTINVSGPVGLAVDVFDQANGVPNAYAVYSIKMRVDGQTVFESRADRFSYNETDQLHLDRIYPLLENTGKAYQRLFVADGNTLHFYTTSGSEGRLNLSPGRHQITIEASDYYGNSRRGQVTLKVQSPAPESARPEEQYPTRPFKPVDPERWQWFNNWVNIPLDDFQQLTLAPLFHSPIIPVYRNNGESVSVDLTRTSQFYFRTSSTDHLITRRVHLDRPAYLQTGDRKAYVSFPKSTYYDTASVAVTKKVFTSDSVQINLFPYDLPLRGFFRISVQMDSLQRADTTLAFYKTDPGSDDLQMMETEKEGRYLKASVNSMGSYLILSDRTPPELGRPRVVKSADDKWLIYIPAKDGRSGIDYEKTKIIANGVRGITEFEPESERLVYYHPEFMPASSIAVKVITFDKMGNGVVKEETIAY